MVPTVEQYEILAASVELTVQQLIKAHNYNTVGNLIRFYEEFKLSGETEVASFFRTYDPPITAEHHTCVGLGLELLQRLQLLEKRFPGAGDKFYLVSCEEAIEDMERYVRCEPEATSVEKEHVLLALQIMIGSRSGILLLDPGYHVARVITVMQDHFYPNTGWFTQSDEPHVRREYCYCFAENSEYIKWMDRETRAGIETTSESVIFVGRPYLSAIHVTERRNLVYNFKCLLARDTKGHVVAGVYFPIKEGARSVIFYQDGNRSQRIRVPLVSSTRDKEEQQVIRLCGFHLGLPPGGLELILDKIKVIMNDENFIRQILAINTNIKVMSDLN